MCLFITLKGLKERTVEEGGSEPIVIKDVQVESLYIGFF